ncbi:Kelch motif-containing protein [Pseudoxanthomonas sp. GM95]|uniref:Kelch repeat-containing protein n=1 Tax=Pseudoxanthomonas sp. GM95 TaxID=1881043 RepID=UPI0008B00803|nr:kelch motif-containing protein [Pseudoxanthomonas sp. GM95]SEL08239.1 Kelch motif-containing protein [Pseudoxanthomonas sp. GM95]
MRVLLATSTLLFFALSATMPAEGAETSSLKRQEIADPDGAGALTWRSLAPRGTPTARHESSFAEAGGKGYLFGGRGDRPLEIFDAATGAWTIGAKPPLEIHHAQAVGFAGRVFVVSALTGPFPEEASLRHVLIYDPRTDRWSNGPEIPKERRRGASGVVTHQGLIYVIGGNTRGHNSGYVPWLDVFDPATGTWTPLKDAPRARDHFQAVAHDGKLYAGGGRRSSYDTGQPLALTISELDIYDIGSGTWSTATAPLPTKRAGTAAALVGGSVVVIGGESDAHVQAHAEVEAYDIAHAQWRTLPALPVGRHGTQAAVISGDLHLVAGSANRGGGPELNDHWVLD